MCNKKFFVPFKMKAFRLTLAIGAKNNVALIFKSVDNNSKINTK